MVQHLVLLFIFCLVGTAQAQDERYYRQILSGELPSISTEFREVPLNQFNVAGPKYLIDLNGDGIEETIQPQKRDGVDWIEIQDSSKRKVFEAKLLAMGAESAIYKIKLTHLSPKLRALIIFLDEGHTTGRRFESTARLFLLSYENNDLSTLKLGPGPHYFHEKRAQRDQYYRRDFQVNVADFNNDGVREIAVQYHHIQRILEYVGNGEWKFY